MVKRPRPVSRKSATHRPLHHVGNRSRNVVQINLLEHLCSLSVLNSEQFESDDDVKIWKVLFGARIVILDQVIFLFYPIQTDIILTNRS